MTVKGSNAGMDGTTVPGLLTDTVFPTKLAVVRDPDPSWQLPEKREAVVFCEPWVSEQSALFLERAAGMVMSMDSRTS